LNGGFTYYSPNSSKTGIMSAADYYQQTAREMRQHAMPSNNPFPESYIGYQSLPVGGQSSPAQFQKSLPLNAQPSAAQTKFKPLPSTSHTPPARDYTNKDYTIGIICALSKEKAAAECFLDAEHAQIEAQPKGDNNVYTLGSIHPHNVVIASLPEGRYGTTNAAAVARDMIRTFPKIRYGLMVGIGGGAPTAKHDIRLGDVVVALPDSLRNEVLQYDFGKTVQEKKFHRVEGMNNCPPLLKSVVSSLRTKYKRKGHPLQEYVESALKANERLRTEYQKPDPSTDILYKSDYVHPEAVDVCSRICAWKPEHMMPRPIPHSLEQELMEGIRVAKEAKERKPNEKTKDRKVKASASKVETLNKGASTTTCATWKGMSSVEAKLAGLSNVKSEPLPQHIQKAPPNIIPTLSSEPMLHSPSFIPAISSKRGIGLLPRDDPTIHYGPVASGNQLLRDAKLRDSLASEAGVLCFEMEASGLMEHFPSLVIRGICDYADTHKNDQWQGYAAMTAAAYAKDVLRNLPIQRVKDEKPAQKTILETVGNWSSGKYHLRM
jgi:nucleoside phosphorylase